MTIAVARDDTHGLGPANASRGRPLSHRLGAPTSAERPYLRPCDGRVSGPARSALRSASPARDDALHVVDMDLWLLAVQALEEVRRRRRVASERIEHASRRAARDAKAIDDLAQHEALELAMRRA